MDLKQELSPEDFKLVFNVPLAGATYVAASSGGSFDMVKELTSASKFMAAEAQKGAESGYGELTDSLLAAMTGMSRDELENHADPVREDKGSGRNDQTDQADCGRWLDGRCRPARR